MFSVRMCLVLDLLGLGLYLWVLNFNDLGTERPSLADYSVEDF